MILESEWPSATAAGADQVGLRAPKISLCGFGLARLSVFVRGNSRNGNTILGPRSNGLHATKPADAAGGRCCNGSRRFYFEESSLASETLLFNSLASPCFCCLVPVAAVVLFEAQALQAGVPARRRRRSHDAESPSTILVCVLYLRVVVHKLRA